MTDPLCLLRGVWRSLPSLRYLGRGGAASPPVSGHDYRTVETHRDCYVTVLRCQWCGSERVLWSHGEPPEWETVERCCEAAT